MNRKPVNSSNIVSVGYEKETKTLEVEFKSGAVWQYLEVPDYLGMAVDTATSVGKFFAINIKGKFDETKVN